MLLLLRAVQTMSEHFSDYAFILFNFLFHFIRPET